MRNASAPGGGRDKCKNKGCGRCHATATLRAHRGLHAISQQRHARTKHSRSYSKHTSSQLNSQFGFHVGTFFFFPSKGLIGLAEHTKVPETIKLLKITPSSVVPQTAKRAAYQCHLDSSRPTHFHKCEFKRVGRQTADTVQWGKRATLSAMFIPRHGL